MNLNLKYEQLWEIILSLSDGDRKKLKRDIAKLPDKKEKQQSDLQKLLLTGPVMSDEQYEAYTNNREYLTKWNKN